MGRHPTKAADNPFCKARLDAAKRDDRLFLKEGAAELLGVSVSTLSDYELGNTKVIPPDMIGRMARLYDAPELENYYCTEMCPLGHGMQKVTVETLDRISIKALDSFRRIERTAVFLLDIAADGEITEEEKPVLEKVIAHLEELEAIAQGLKMWVKKNL